MKPNQFIARKATPESNDLERALNPKRVVHTIECSNGTNTYAHKLKTRPIGRVIVFATATITDVSLDGTNWVFTASGNGSVKVEFIFQ